MMRIALLLLMFLSNVAVAASFDCQQAERDLDKAICSDLKLSTLDETMSTYYSELKATLASEDGNQLLQEQRAWLKLRETECGAGNTECLLDLYEARILALRKQSENLVPYEYKHKLSVEGSDNPSAHPQVKPMCGFAPGVITDDTLIYAGGAYSGQKIDYQIDQSGHQATQFEVVVNSPDKPVALLLGAYEPSIWNIAWTQGTRIAAVVATGYHRQAVAGLPGNIPVLISSYDNQGPCGYTYVGKRELKTLNPISKMAFNKTVALVHFAKQGELLMGEPVQPSEPLFTSQDTPPTSFVDKTKPLAGEAGLRDLVRQGLIRKATRQDALRWAQMKAASYQQEEDLPPVAGGSSLPSFMPGSIHNGYVILAPITIPAGLYGGHSAAFFLEKGVPYPKGELGHSELYDFNNQSCTGPGCGMH
ncbi:lysozyme inhibitor LprI family protein [Aestuariirhabdus sp. Z084]|uniref:lysozyme inhibitor LprI family protein n=1 Tax=Aestuariirhabdus haliotis TaxID=2918751 RepID=UPI00201B36E4|nr:lysozyme inhibitor LprI family protein [Aestuariirhabdus haliotis]MCL6416413.1 lysozyme inhibitor LprI family protein [Aestuariirhabdus haliotis]MCL6420421.1 lysozyme inhibitor LprI family protein [Aestuariirhabdus haliotis]